jgi:hypothetical protein
MQINVNSTVPNCSCDHIISNMHSSALDLHHDVEPDQGGRHHCPTQHLHLPVALGNLLKTKKDQGLNRTKRHSAGDIEAWRGRARTGNGRQNEMTQETHSHGFNQKKEILVIT